MIANKQWKFYNELHDRLGEQYLIKEKYRVAIVTFYDNYKTF